MQFFNIFKKNKDIIKPNLKEQLSYIIEYIPDFYKDKRQYINTIDYLEHNELGMTVESLIELTKETGHYFSEEFWEILADIAKSMDMPKSSTYCLKQIDCNQEDLKSNTPFGWTTVKFDNNHFQHYISEKIKVSWVTKRQKKDNVNSLLENGEGIYLKMNGKTGTLYVVNQGRLAEIELELGMLGLILYFTQVTHWILPLKEVMTFEEKQNIRTDINYWASNTKNAIEFDD